ncbi:MAG: hypothetical protein QXH21_09210 [Ignisphaera sp.]
MKCSDISREDIVDRLYEVSLKNNTWFNKRKVLAVKCYDTNISSEFIVYLPRRVVRVIFYNNGKTTVVVT